MVCPVFFDFQTVIISEGMIKREKYGSEQPEKRDRSKEMDRDFSLIQKMRAGDEAAAEAFVKKYYPAILRYCCLHICNREDGEDAAQETFERFFRTFEKYRHYGKAGNYLYVIAGNVCKDYFRRKKDVVMAEMPETEGKCMEGLEELMDISRILKSLPEELQETAILYFVQERKQKEIAKITGISLSLVKYRVKRVRELLIKELKGGENREKR